MTALFLDIYTYVIMTSKKKTIIITGFIAVALIVTGFRVPKWASNSYVKTERGSFESYVLSRDQEDWRGIRPCLPYGYSKEIPNGTTRCPEGSDTVITKSICWFGVPGPRIRICYKNTNSAEMVSQPLYVR